MNAYQQKIEIRDLVEGMFICQLPIPWKETPFPLQGFYVHSNDDKTQLEKYCSYVFVDIIRSRTKNLRLSPDLIKNNKNDETTKSNVMPSFSKRENNSSTKKISAKPILKNYARYAHLPVHDLRKTYKVAIKIHSKIVAAIKQFSEIEEKNREKIFTLIKDNSRLLVESALHNPDALIWLTRLQSQKADIFNHSINAAIWGLVLGRHLGLERDILNDLTLALLLAKTGLLNENKFSETKTPLDYIFESVANLSDAKDITPGVITTIKTHMERYDGSGGPRGLTGDKIPYLGKIAGIVDCYESLLNPLDNYPPLTCSEAIGFLFSQRDIKFQADLVEEFIQAIGIYPTGSLVELNNNEIGLVLESPRNERLFPKLLMVVDKDGHKIKQPRTLNLADDKTSLSIKRSIPNSTVNINYSALGNKETNTLRKIFSL